MLMKHRSCNNIVQNMNINVAIVRTYIFLEARKTFVQIFSEPQVILYFSNFPKIQEVWKWSPNPTMTQVANRREMNKWIFLKNYKILSLLTVRN